MNESGRRWLTILFLDALLIAVLVAWSPFYWPVAVSLIGVGFVAVVWAAATKRVFLSPELIPVLLLAAWGFLQLLFGSAAIPFLTMRASLTWVGCALSFLLGLNMLAPRNERRWFLQALMWASSLLAIEAILQLYLAPTLVFGLFQGMDSVTGTFFYRNQFAAFMELVAPIALWRIRKGQPVIGSLCFAAMFGAVVATASRAGTVLLIVEVVCFLAIAFFGRSQLKSYRGAGLVLLVFAVAAAAVVGTDRVWERFQEKNYFEIRTELRASTVRMIRDAPLFGTGLGTWRAAYPRYATMDAALIANEAHNDWVQWMSDGGIPFALLLMVITLRAGLRSTAKIWGLGMLAVMVHCLVDYPMRTPAVSLLWFAMAGMACASGREIEEVSSPQATSTSKTS